MKITALFIILALFLIPSSIGAETIYTWKDKDGVMRFSNEPPPEGVTDYETIETPGETPGAEPNAPAAESKRRSSYDQMVQRASKEAIAAGEQRKKAAAEKAAEQQRIAEEQRKAELEAERERLESQIEAIERRAVSRTYPNGMKQAQIEALRKEIEKLELGPDPKTAEEQQKETGEQRHY